MGLIISFLLLSCGISAIWSLSDIFTPVRNLIAKKAPKLLRKLLLCMECSSFWIGFICSFIFFPAVYVESLWFIPSELLSAIYSGAITYLTIKIINKKELI